MYPVFDSHAHYDADWFDEDREELLAALPERGVCCVINAATDLNSADVSIELARKYPYIYAAVGVHPQEIMTWNDDTEARMIQQLAQDKAVAVGEIGLDYHYDDGAPREIQRKWFVRQLEIAKELDLPVVIHDREAHGDMYDILRKYAPLRGVMHCFSGSIELARETLRFGLHIGLGGVVTFKNARASLEVASQIPLDRLLLETDAPYLSPVPFRGKRCESPMIVYTAAKIAELRGVTPDDVLRAACENACALYGVKLDDSPHQFGKLP